MSEIKRNCKYKTEQEKVKARSKYIVKKVKQWQEYPYSRPLRCQSEGDCFAILRPKIHPRTNEVYLKCPNPNCNYTQTEIPEHILHTNIVVFEHAAAYHTASRKKFLELRKKQQKASKKEKK